MGEYFSVFEPHVQNKLREEVPTAIPKDFLQNPDLRKAAISIQMRFLQGLRTGEMSQTEQDLMVLLHGERARVLGDKSAFPGLLKQLGYTAPGSLLVHPHSSEDAIRTYYAEKQIEEVFCKPLNGTRQRDLHPFALETPQFAQYIAGIKEDTLVQEFMPHTSVLRYIQYTDRKGQSYVGCFAYDEDKSERRKVYNIPLLGNIHVKGSGETVNEFLTSAHNTIARPLSNEKAQQDNLQQFMSGAIQKIEKELACPIPFFSCDIGINDMTALEGVYDEEQIKKNVIFFESQGAPNPWGGKKKESREDVKTYWKIWQLYLQEHATEMVPRIDQLRQIRRGRR